MLVYMAGSTQKG